MNYYFVFAGITLSFVVIGIYLYSCITKSKQEPDLGDGVSLFLSCNGIAAGIKVAYLAILAQPGTTLGDDRIYVLLGGLAVIWVSIQTIIKTIQNPIRTQDRQQSQQEDSRYQPAGIMSRDD